jgi:hypothetical protein
MGEERAQKDNNILQNKTLVTTSPNKNNLDTVATRRPLARNCRNEGPKHNLEIPDLNRI